MIFDSPGLKNHLARVAIRRYASLLNGDPSRRTYETVIVFLVRTVSFRRPLFFSLGLCNGDKYSLGELSSFAPEYGV